MTKKENYGLDIVLFIIAAFYIYGTYIVAKEHSYVGGHPLFVSITGYAAAAVLIFVAYKNFTSNN